MKNISRRKFLVDSSLLVGLFQVSGLLEGCDLSQKEIRRLQSGLHLIDESGLNVVLYFINLKFQGTKLVPADSTQDSYLIAQIPPQSLHDSYFKATSATDRPKGHMEAKLAGPSYLSFRLWPDPEVKKKLRLTTEDLLDWSDSQYFKLITTSDVSGMQVFAQPGDVIKAGVVRPKAPLTTGLDYYQELTRKLLTVKNQFLTLLELPQGLLLAPHTWKNEDGSPQVKVEVVQNNYLVSFAEYKHRYGDKKLHRTVRERWNTQIKYYQQLPSCPNFLTPIPPALRAIGVISGNFMTEGDVDLCKVSDIQPKDLGNYLPSMLDVFELVFLNQQANQARAFDIQLDTPFLLTTSGASLMFHYKNYNIPNDPSFKTISLVEYEHHFQDGRDNFIKIARIGVIAPSSQKALHIKIAERKIANGVSYMDYKEYVEVIEPVKDFPPVAANSLDTKYRSYNNIPHYNNQLPFNSVKAGFVRTPPIRPMETSPVNHFWVYKEFSQGDTTGDLLLMPFQYTDRNGKLLENSLHSLYFMRRDFFSECTPNTDITDVLGPVPAGATAKMLDFDDGHMRIPFNNQVVSFTPDDPAAGKGDDIRNKVNQLETEFVDYYFNVANPIAGISNVFDKAPYVIFPQVSRAKAYVDHIQQYTTQKIPSVIAYHRDYLDHFFESETNKAKLVIEHTKGFLTGAVAKFDNATLINTPEYQQLNHTYEQIKGVFTAAADKIGGLVNPDIQIERFALVKQALTLPDNVNKQWQGISSTVDRKLKALDIFNGKSPRILNAIDLKQILQDLLPASATPLFDLNKTMGDLTNVNAYIQQLGSNGIVQKAMAEIQKINEQVSTVTAEYNTLKNTVQQYQQQFTDAQTRLINSFPDINKLQNACKLYFQQERFKLFSLATTAVADAKAFVKDEFIQAVKDASVLKDKVLIDIFNNVADIEIQLRQAIATMDQSDKVLVAQLTLISAGFLGQFKATVLDLVGTFSDTTKTEQEKLRLAYNNGSLLLAGMEMDYYFGIGSLDELKTNLQLKVRAYIQATTEAGKITIQKEINDFNAQLVKKQNDLANGIYGLIGTFIRSYAVFQGGLSAEYKKKFDTIYSFLALYQKSFTSYYIDRYNQYAKDYQDIKNTVDQLKVLFDQVESIGSETAQARLSLVKACIDSFLQAGAPPEGFNQAWAALNTNDQQLIGEMAALLQKDSTTKLLEQIGAKPYVDAVLKAKNELAHQQTALEDKIVNYTRLVKQQSEGIIQQVTDSFNSYIRDVTDQAEIQEASLQFAQAIQILKTPIQKEIKYQWQTTAFKSINLGIVSFNAESNPPTAFSINVSGKITVDPLKYPQVITGIETYAENTLTNFGITFLSVITIDFASLSFVTGSKVAKNFSVHVRDVQFGGSLSFIQLLEELLSNLGSGFSMSIATDEVAIAYNSPVLSIGAPAFTFANISLGVKLEIFFDQRPVLLTFYLSSPENKATVSAAIYGGCFYCGVGIEPQRGVRSIEMALEMGAYLGISLGPISGYVKFMVGLYFKKDDNGVTMDGYFVAEGILSIWILSVAARLYMYVRSQNSQVSGGCTVTYSVKLGFIKKSFSGSYSKTLAGANNSSSASKQDAAVHLHQIITDRKLSTFAAVASAEDYQSDDYYHEGGGQELEEILYALYEEDTYRPMNPSEFRQFHQTFCESPFKPKS